LAQHFGHCEQFALIDADEAKKEITESELIASPGHEPGRLPKHLAEKGVDVVIAGGMGSRAQMLFQQSGIKVVVGAVAKDPEEAVLSYLNGSLDTEGNICDH
jgi:predicted Fe-Mo cluster-binding NifX family protein